MGQLGEKEGFPGKEAAFYMEAKPECEFFWNHINSSWC